MLSTIFTTSPLFLIPKSHRHAPLRETLKKLKISKSQKLKNSETQKLKNLETQKLSVSATW